ncbi:MAG: hypothetical protein JZU58_03040 [Curvibacter lanceolatus]|uniref:hypothetical protein n=1 Tax=Curvibacter lanceolatus TaxID=86182 RepID=UPI0023566AB3|nr:hypothetical protein [Curvibacter lanceolatus]MBV5291300.1 hypothetical protein [Curvibacter lanceolatus]
MTQELEIIGRLQLWLGALEDCIQCIQLCHRMHLTARSPELELQEKARQQHFEKIIDRIENAHVAYVADQSAYDSFRRWLPTEQECDQIIFHLHRLAAVYFLQIYTKGNAELGAVMGNMTTESKALREKLERSAFHEEPELENFQCLKATLLEFRHGEIAHADGARMQVRHQSNGVSYTLNGIDTETIKAMQALIPKFREAVRLEASTRLSR